MSLVHLKMKENTGGLTGATDTIPQGTGSSTTATSVGTLLLSVAGAVSTVIADAKRVWKPENKTFDLESDKELMNWPMQQQIILYKLCLSYLTMENKLTVEKKES